MMKKVTYITFLTLVLLTAFSCSATMTRRELSPLNIDRNPGSDIQLTSIILVDTIDLEIVPPSMGVHFYRDGIMFLAYSGYDDNMLSNHLSFGKPKAYFSNIYEGTLFKYVDFSPTMPFSYPCDAVTFSSDYKTMYFTKISDVDGKEKIYKATFTTSDNFQTGWTADGFPLSICTGDYIYSHPALSPDGKILIVCSNRQDSHGGMDLYISEKEGNNWSDLKNMGTVVNSSSNEFYPFIDSSNNLYFSSDKKGGSGGYDIYICKYNGKGWYKPVPLTDRINTPGDDIAFSVDSKNGTSAFYTSVELPGRSNPRLLRVSVNEEALKKNPGNLSEVLFNMTGAHFEPASRSAFQVSTQLATSEKQSSADKSKTANAAANKKNSTNNSATTQSKSTQTAPASSGKTTASSESKTASAKTGTVSVVYRVQILSGSKPKGNYSITVNKKTYNTFEYFYKGAYRITIGEYGSYSEALKLLNECHNEYPNAFVAVFRNNERVNDPSLLK